jgi:hypothetical protein
MPTYQDRTWCNYLRCKNRQCNRRTNNKIRKEAKESKLALAVYAEKPDCYSLTPELK